MPAQRIPDLATLTAAELAADDKFVVYDLSQDKYKSLTKDEFAIMMAASIPPEFVIAQFIKAHGAGSGTDADLLDGKHAAAFAQLTGAAFTGNVSVTGTLNVDGASSTVGGLITASEFATKLAVGTSTGTLTVSSANQTLFINSTCTIAPNVFTKGDCITFYGTGTGGRVRGAGGFNIYKDNGFRTPIGYDVYLDVNKTASLLIVSPTEGYITGGGDPPV